MSLERYCRWCQGQAEALPDRWFGQYAMVEDEAIHYVEAGQGRPVILIHGFMAWSFTWRKNLGPLARHARVLAPDLRGFGLSERSPRRRHSLSDQVEVLRGFLDRVGIDRAVLCGHSMGGEIALRMGLAYPERVEALILDAASGYVRRAERPVERWLLRLPGISSLFVRAVVMNRRFASSALRAGYRSPDHVTESDIDAYLLPARAPGSPRTFVQMLREIDFGHFAPNLREVRHRSLLVWGENDPWVPLEHGKRLAADLPNSELAIFPECGHLPHEEHPEAFNRLVISFLQSL